MAASKEKISPETKQQQQQQEQVLPQEILLEIFAKLPTKSAGKCRCLSKHWSIQLSTPHFIKKHLKIRQNNKQENLVLVDKAEKSFVVVTCPTNKQQESRKDISPDFDLASYYVLGSCNGLILLLGKGRRKLHLINPITLKQVNLPELPTTKHNVLPFTFGFGYDCVSEEYTVVAVAYYVNTASETVVEVYVHSVKKSGSWRVVKDVGWLGSNCDILYHSRVLFKGALHWEAQTRFSNVGRLIAVLDLASESFHWIQYPSKLTRDVRYSTVMALGGCLCMVDSDGGSVDLWIMKEYGVVESWSNVRIHGDGVWEAIRLLCVDGDEKVLGVSDKDKWYLCDLRERTCKEVAVDVKSNTLYPGGGCPFVDSLVDPEQLVNFQKEVAS